MARLWKVVVLSVVLRREFFGRECVARVEVRGWMGIGVDVGVVALLEWVWWQTVVLFYFRRALGGLHALEECHIA